MVALFTGLVQGLGTVVRSEGSDEGRRLVIKTPLAVELHEGDSVAVSGVCLTAADIGPGSFAANVINETLARSSLGGLGAGSPVNLELPLRAGDPLGGHIVQGHIDGTGTVAGVSEDGFARTLRIDASAQVLRYVVHKGSIAVDGVSLTIAGVEDRSFTVSLIPETLQRTNLGRAQAGTKVNLEVDVLAKYVEKLVGSAA